MNDILKKNEDIIEIDLRKLLRSYLRKWWLIVLCTLLVGGGTLLYTLKFVTPLYQASITVYVNNARSGERIDVISGSSLQAAQKLVSTYTNIIQSDTVLSEVVREAKVDYTPADMRKLLSTQQLGDTELFHVFITHPDPEEAAFLANAVADVAPAEIESFVEGSSAKVIDYAKVPETLYSPNYGLNTLYGALAGFALALIYITLRCLLDVRIKEESDLTSLFAYPVLGQIPHFDQAASGKRGAYGEPYAAAPKEKEGRRKRR